ncbi:outer membrane protein assembly factor BamA [Ferrovibrio terrae]|uniref:outer membrane protein assembly factor BamA n=1 Tax=Ferrovibrio terrae TaxID=2594003 RepID=UPI0031382862
MFRNDALWLLRRIVMVAVLAVGLFAVQAPVDALAQQGGTIRDIVIEGNQRIELSTIQNYLTLQPGSLYSSAEADKSLKALFATGLFADVNLRLQGSSLIVRVTENPVINRILFEGNRRVQADQLRSELQLKPRQVYTRSKVQTDTQRIQQIYRRTGRFAATIEPKVIQLPQNRVDLVFEINEGPLTGVSRIRFIGNRQFSDSKLREEIQTKETAWWRFLSSDDSYDPDRVTFDREKLRKFYLSKGFADFAVTNAVAELLPNREKFIITFTVEEGERYKFGKMDVVSELKGVDGAQMKEFVVTPTGETYNADLVEKTVQSITTELGRFGYAFVDVRPDVNKDREKRIIDITYRIGESPRVFVERIDIVGNVRTLDKVVRREFRLAEGDAFNSAKLRRTRTRLRGLNFFDKVEIAESRGSAPDKVVLTAEVTEKSTGELSFGVGYSTTESVLGDVSIRERNLLGRGQDLKVGFSLSTTRQQADLSFTEPYFLDRELAAGVDLVRRRTDYTRRSSLDQTTTSGTTRLSFPITENLSQLVYYRIRQDEIDNIETSASRFIRAQEGRYITSAVGHALTYDRRDDKVDPTTGYYLRLSQEVAGLGGTEFYVKNVGNAAKYFPITDETVLTFSTELGMINGLSDVVRLPNRFFVGGDSFRGFAVGGIGPRDTTTSDSLGGQKYYTGEADLMFPIGLPNEFGIKGRLFSVAGSLWDTPDAGREVVDENSMRVSAGAGIQWKSPLGLIRVDFGFPLIKEKYDEEEIVRINFGSRF